jgi:hypothetical protein
MASFHIGMLLAIGVSRCYVCMWRVSVGLLGVGVGYVCMERGVDVVNGIDGHRMELLSWFPVLLGPRMGVSRMMAERHFCVTLKCCASFIFSGEDDSESAKFCSEGDALSRQFFKRVQETWAGVFAWLGWVRSTRFWKRISSARKSNGK